MDIPMNANPFILIYKSQAAVEREKRMFPNSQDIEEGIYQVLAHMWLVTQLDSSPSSNVASTSSSSSSRLRKPKRPEFERKLREFFKHQIVSDTSSSNIFG